MAKVVTDGNGNTFQIRRSLAEKAILTIASAGVSLVCATGLFIARETYNELREQHDEIIKIGGQMRVIAEQSSEALRQSQANGKAISDHEDWARDQRGLLDHRIDGLERQK